MATAQRAALTLEETAALVAQVAMLARAAQGRTRAPPDLRVAGEAAVALVPVPPQGPTEGRVRLDHSRTSCSELHTLFSWIQAYGRRPPR